MITNGTLIVLVSRAAPPQLTDEDDLSRIRHADTLRNYFGIISQTTSEERALIQARNGARNDTIIVVERGFFPEKNDREAFKGRIKKAGVLENHILFGENYASGYHHIILKINELCG